MHKLLVVLSTCLLLQGCITKVVTVPVKAVYTVGKYTVKGTAAVVGAMIPDGDDEKKEAHKQRKSADTPPEPTYPDAATTH